MDTVTAQALIRFGLGPRPSEQIPSDPHGWLAGQVRMPDPARFDGLVDSGEALREYKADNQAKLPPQEHRGPKLFRAEAMAQLAEAVGTAAPYRERLVMFWANHFTVSRRAGAVNVLAGPYVREAIRPHVTGRFHDMLLAVMHHPAMLYYLNNAGSMGPRSPTGMRRQGGLNENLARELLELHTLSPAAGYTQADVTSYAAILTGWSVAIGDDYAGFKFRPGMHEPGAKTLMGRSFPEGEQGGLDALAFLATHPATHRHLATKLVRHFVADNPPPAAVARIEAVLRDSGGDLGAASLALIDVREAWTPLTKLRSPEDYLLAMLRASDMPASPMPAAVGILTALGESPWNAAFPNGWPDTAAEWAGPEEMVRRLDWAYSFSGRIAERAVPEQVAAAALGPFLRPATVQAMQHAGSRRDSLALLFSSPEFQRR